MRTRWKMLPAGTVKRVHVNRRIMSKNLKLPEDKWKPYYTIQTSKGPIRARRVRARLEFDIHNPKLSCGARAYGVTRGTVFYA